MNRKHKRLLAVIGVSAVAGAATYGILSVTLGNGHQAAQASCLNQVRGWSATSSVAESTMVSDVQTLSGDLNQLSTDASAGDQSAVTTDARTMQADTGTWQADLNNLRGNVPPACAVSLHRSYTGALQDYGGGAVALQQAATEILAGQYAQSPGSLQQATVLIDQGNALIGQATNDLKKATGQG